MLASVADWLEWKRDRILCRLAHWHGYSCRGRPDHIRDGANIDPDRWKR
jgi:hypothetical protein